VFWWPKKVTIEMTPDIMVGALEEQGDSTIALSSSCVQMMKTWAILNSPQLNVVVHKESFLYVSPSKLDKKAPI
jgi:hypothetical protein